MCWCPWYCNESSWSANVPISNRYWRGDLKACSERFQTVPPHAQNILMINQKAKKKKNYKWTFVTHLMLIFLATLQQKLGWKQSQTVRNNGSLLEYRIYIHTNNMQAFVAFVPVRLFQRRWPSILKEQKKQNTNQCAHIKFYLPSMNLYVLLITSLSPVSFISQ